MIYSLESEILRVLTDEFPGVAVALYPRLRRKITVPAVLIELDALESAGDDGTERLHFAGRFYAHVLMDLITPDADPICWDLAASVAKVIQGNGRFGQRVGPARIARIEDNAFRPELAGMVVKTVEWSHDLALGESIWTDPGGIVPTTIYLGCAPDIGIGHEDDYSPVTELPA